MPLSEVIVAGDSSADPPRLSEDIDSTCSTPFVSAPSSPGRAASGYFFSAPTSPMHYLFTIEKNDQSSSVDCEPVFLLSDSGSFEFEFSSRFSPSGSGAAGSMTAADELFFNGQIRPIKLSSHLEKPHDLDTVAPYVDLYGDDVGTVRGRDLRSRSMKYSHRKARSMSPLRGEWRETTPAVACADHENEITENDSTETTPSSSTPSSRSSSSGRNSKKWIFLKDLLRRSKSEGGTPTNKDGFWSAISFSPAKDKAKTAAPPSSATSPALSPPSSRDETKGKPYAQRQRKSTPPSKKPAKGVWRRPSAHELHYTANRAQAAEMKKKTFLPYRQGLLGCLGFSSKTYGAFSGFTKTLNPISSR